MLSTTIKQNLNPKTQPLRFWHLDTSRLCVLMITAMTKKEIREYLAKIGAKGGKTTGKSKVRGDSDYYRRIRAKRGKKKKGDK